MSQNQTRESLIEEFKSAVDGLYFPSESDYPIQVFLWPIPTDQPLMPEELLRQTGHAGDSAVQMVELEDFFQPVTQEQDWFGAEELAMTQRFQSLVNLIRQQLSDVQVYRVGEVEIDVYIVGRLRTGDGRSLLSVGHRPAFGDRLVLATKVVET